MSRRYLLTLVAHDQSESIADRIEAYERSLAQRGLPDIPFHAGPLMNGHEAYESLGLEVRKALLVSFNVLVQRLPVQYATFGYRRDEVSTDEALSTGTRRDISAFIFDNLSFFQDFDKVKVYYDDGQAVVSRALHASVEFALAREASLFKKTRYSDCRLSQVADHLCAVELAALKYEGGEQTSTDDKFFGGIGAFKRNFLKQARRKRMN